MAQAWWRDSDYKLFSRLNRERDDAMTEIERLRAELRQNGIDYTRAEVERLKGLLKETRPFLLAMSADALLGRIAQALQEPPR